jgi:hypothetical protein
MKLFAVLTLLAAGPVHAAEDLCAVSTAGTTVSLRPGDKGTLVIALSLVEGAHVSEDAPLKISLRGEKVTFDKALLSLGDSVAKKQVGESPRFEVGFVPAAGAKLVEANLSFYVCTATQCVRQTRTVSVPLEVL